MPNSLHIKSEGVIFKQNFENPVEVAKAGGTVTGSPLILNGIVLDGTNDYVTYDIPNTLLAKKEISFVIEFIPDFDWDTDVTATLFSTTSDYFGITKVSAAFGNLLFLVIGNEGITVAPATYSPYWKQNERNVVVVSSNGVLTNIWLNGTQILTNDATAWSVKYVTELYIGCADTGSQKFDGEIKSFSIHSRLLTQLDVTAIQNNSMFNFFDKSSVWLDMKSQVGKPTGTNLLTDGDMEAVGTDDWTNLLGIMSKETDNPYQGTQVFRSTETGGASFTGHAQTVLTNTLRYRFTGVARGDGTSQPYLSIDDAANTVWLGSSSTSWQLFDIVCTTASTSLTFGGLSMPASGWVEFDILNAELIEQNVLDKSGNGNDFLLGDGSTSTTIPTFSSPGFDLDGSTDYMLNDSASGIFNNAEQSIVLCFKPDFSADDSANHYLFDSTASNRYAVVKDSANQLNILLGETSVQAITFATWRPYWNTHGINVLVISGESANTDAYLNGVKILDSDSTAWTEKNPTEIYLGSRYSTIQFYDGEYFHFSTYAFKLSTIQSEHISNYLMGEYN